MSRANDSLCFAFAGPADDADLRQLLRANPMRGAIRVGFTHEPNYFSGTRLAGAEDRTLTAREHGRLVAAGRCTVQPRWLNGEVRRCAYLGELRLDTSVQGRWDILRRGYAFFAAEYAREPADFCFTSIVSDNRAARRILERGIRGLPRYEPLGGFNTLLLRARDAGRPLLPAGLKLMSGDAVSITQLTEFLNSCARNRNLTVEWTTERLASLSAHGLRISDFLVIQQDDRIVGCAALWDQRTFRQIVVHSYAPWLNRLRPLANFSGAVLGWPHLPVPGTTLAHAFLSPLTVASEFTTVLPWLIVAGLGAAARRGFDCVALGFADCDPLWPDVARAFRGRKYESKFYAVQWPSMTASVSKLDARPFLPELALL